MLNYQRAMRIALGTIESSVCNKYIYLYISADPGRRKGERAREERCLTKSRIAEDFYQITRPDFARISDDTLGIFFAWF